MQYAQIQTDAAVTKRLAALDAFIRETRAEMEKKRQQFASRPSKTTRPEHSSKQQFKVEQPPSSQTPAPAPAPAPRPIGSAPRARPSSPQVKSGPTSLPLPAKAPVPDPNLSKLEASLLLSGSLKAQVQILTLKGGMTLRGGEELTITRFLSDRILPSSSKTVMRVETESPTEYPQLKSFSEFLKRKQLASYKNADRLILNAHV